MAAQLKQTLGLEAELVRGDAGVFDVDALPSEGAARRVFSKSEAGRFPRADEVLDALRRVGTPGSTQKR